MVEGVEMVQGVGVERVDLPNFDHIACFSTDIKEQVVICKRYKDDVGLQFFHSGIVEANQVIKNCFETP